MKLIQGSATIDELKDEAGPKGDSRTKGERRLLGEEGPVGAKGQSGLRGEQGHPGPAAEKVSNMAFPCALLFPADHWKCRKVAVI